MSIIVVGTIGYDTVETQHGGVTDALGGSASFFALAARFFSPVSIVAVVGSAFKPEHMRLFTERNIDVRGLVRPDLLPDQRRSDYIFLANISPDLQTHVLEQVASPKIVAADTMNHWIANERQELIKLLPRLDILTVNDEEARMLSGEHNLVKAGRAILKMGPDTVLVKRGEYGVLQFSQNSLFAVPAYPLEEVIDPTGAGDAFAGAFMGYIARHGRVTESILRTAVVYGTVMGSYVVEQFSVDRLTALTWEDVESRYRAFIELTDSHHSRWMSQ